MTEISLLDQRPFLKFTMRYSLTSTMGWLRREIADVTILTHLKPHPPKPISKIQSSSREFSHGLHEGGSKNSAKVFPCGECCGMFPAKDDG